MRQVLAEGLAANRYTEHPAAYFALDGLGPEKWKSLMVDQDRQRAEVAIGLGGSSSCQMSEAIADVNPRSYAEAVDGGRIPLGSATRFSDSAQETRAIKMALSTLQPLDDRLHRQRFEGRSLFEEPWLNMLRSLGERGLLVMDRSAQRIELTPNGKTLVEAIINTEL
jgi:oxygen-independent coproporphyrinogen-3 oxidase